jgi:histidyl-tRNA synthetase
VIKINSRKLLDAMVQLVGAPPSKFKSICSSIDKLDKEEWKNVRRELVEEKGLTEQAADRLGEFCTYKGPALETF